jgi:outer membrane protein OmpA-like peptidoglycan-associated protein
MTPDTALKHKLLFLLLLVGPLSFAQETGSKEVNHSKHELPETNLKSEAVPNLSECLSYSGYVVNKKTGDPIAKAHIKMTNSDNELVATLRTDQSGYYKFLIPCNQKSKIAINAHGYSKESRIVRTDENPKSASINNRIYLTPFESLVEKEGSIEKIKLGPNYFKSHKKTMLAQDKTALKNVLFTMLKFPEIRIKIESYSNAGGTDISNAVLSYFHAKASRRYLISQGINADRIESANGSGLNRPENDCLNYEGQESVNTSLSDFIIVSN